MTRSSSALRALGTITSVEIEKKTRRRERLSYRIVEGRAAAEIGAREP
jgi:hypothetical protein